MPDPEAPPAMTPPKPGDTPETVQPDDARPKPIDLRTPCYLCVAGFAYSTARIELMTSDLEPGPKQTFHLDGIRWDLDVLEGGRMNLWPLAGYPAAVVDLARLADSPRAHWALNGEWVRMWAEINLFGLGVCLSDAHRAIELWKSGRRW